MAKEPSLRKKPKSSNRLLQGLIVVTSLLALVFLGEPQLLNQFPILNGSPSIVNVNTATQASPTNGQKIWLKNQSSVRFEWSGPINEDTFLEISRDRDFKDLVLEEPSPKFPFLTDKLPGDGDYFYRIVQKSSEQENVLLKPVAFTIVTQNPPQLIYPFTPMSIPETKPLRFYWQGKHGVTHYRFQIAFDALFENLFSDLLVEETQTIPQKIPAGHFFWRVRGEDDSTASTLWSEVRVLRSEGVPDIPPVAAAVTLPPPPVTTKAKNPPPAKTLASPKVAKTIQKFMLHYRNKENLRSPASLQNALITPPILSWSKSKGALSYEVQISKKSNFSQIEWTKSVSAPKTKWDLAKPGKYFWRVQALGETGAKSPFSSLNTLDLSLPAPKIKKLFSHNVKVKSEAQLSEPSPMPISWAEVVAASGYRVVVSENKNFSPTLLDLKVDRNLASVELNKNGHYFAKVAVLGASGEIVSDYSDIAGLEYEKNYEKKSPSPKVTLPAPQPKLPPNGVSIVSLNESQDPISFKWEATDADAYQLEIASDEKFQQIIHTVVIRENQIVVSKTIPMGRLYWHVRAKKDAYKSDWSPTFSFEFAK
ncbi:MAG TPA: hypothetical protein VIG33_17735 [Pseudobdellovibrionaceae bacterium]|jgi:hypothetical protein